MSANGVARRSGLQGDGTTAPDWLRLLICDAKHGVAQLWGNVDISPASTRRAVEWLVQQPDMEQATALLYIARYRPQYYKDLMPYFSFVVRTQRAAATRLRNIPLNGRSRGSIIITRRGVIMG